MKSKSIACLVFLLLLTSETFPQLYALRTENLHLIYYSKGHEFVISHLARCFENSLRSQRKLFDYTPSEEITVLLEDFRDYGNAGAKTIPDNFVLVGLAPYNYVYETSPSNERMNFNMLHELVHIVASDKAAGSDRFFRTLFTGKVSTASDQPLSMFYSYLTTPRWYAPRWYHEGIAVFMETWLAGGLGRALGPYDEMVFRSMVRDSAYIYDLVGLESEGKTIDFQVGANSYLYGTRFMSYLAYQYGPEKLLQWVARAKGTKGGFAGQFKRVFGNSLDNEWSKWIAWEHQWQQANLDSIRLNPTTPFRPISKRALGSVSRAFYDPPNGKLYAAMRYPGQIASIAAIDIRTGAIDKICNVEGSGLYYVSSLAFDPVTQTIFFTTDNNGWRDLNAVDLKTGDLRRLMKDVRTGDLAFNRADSSLWGVRHFNGYSTLVRIPHPYKEWHQIHTFDYGTDIFDIDISPDGTMMTGALVDIGGRQKLVKFDAAKLRMGDASFDELADFEESAPANFVFTADGKYLYGSSYYSGVANIYRYDITNNQTDIISNCESGFFRPVPISADSLIVFRYTGRGFVPVMIANGLPENVSAVTFLGNEIVQKYPIVREWIAGSPADIDLDSLTTYSGSYNTLTNLKLSSIYPVVEGYKDFPAYGLRFNFADRLGFSNLDLTACYTPNQIVPDDQRLHLRFNFRHWAWRLFATYNGADFYDLFGPTKTSRKGYSVGLQYEKTLFYDEPRALKLTSNLAGYGDLERLPDFQNISATFDKLAAFRANLHYENLRSSLGAVDAEAGTTWGLTFRSNYVNKEHFPRIHADLDYGILLPLDHSSIWLRASAGQSFGDRDNPFANFYFGGFGNNWVDYLSISRYREFYSFAGTELNAIGGKNFAKAQLEWTLPPLRFRRFGIPSLYMRWARLALFSTGIWTNFDDQNSDRRLLNLGGQIDFRLVLFSTLNSTFSLGYGVAVEENRSPEKKFMISLKIL